MDSAIMKFGEMLMKSKNFSTVEKNPIFAWAEDGDIVLLGEAPEDFNGRVCSVELPGEEKPLLSRIYRDGEKVLLGYMDNYDVWASYPMEDVTIRYEVLAVVHLYGQKERPQAADAWEKRAAKAVKEAIGKFTYKTFEQLRQHHVSGHTFETLAAAFSIGYQAGKKAGGAK